MNKKENATWQEVEEGFATGVIRQAKEKSRRWFVAWVITLAALIASNAAWMYATRR